MPPDRRPMTDAERDTFIGDLPPEDGRDWDCQCARCGSSCYLHDCWKCGGNGGDDGEALMEEDPLWYGPDDWRTCDICRGLGGWRVCASGGDWCEGNPLPGREQTPRGTIEWFVIPAPPQPETRGEQDDG